ncbi:hypothetical protein GGS23DRAFT_84572 [Durotheca rogersii]|uniref:uncharacterized protein n=1 Tax=Durotheca rogersii TaxID=419775 RepID=UPI00221EFFDF|nr:uncharacterized protein GGS23DRAFT_84572 [Durotheca rogersii]KAI5862616.1 hypothetical protein GGS23DRAFT_84572 [Durotheca rogersii]
MAADVEAFTELALAICLIGVRIYARWVQVGPANWQADDYLMPLSGIIFALDIVAAYLVVALFGGLTNSYMTDAERERLHPDDPEYFNRQWGSKIQVIGWSLYAFGLWTLKFCVAVFYGRLTTGLSHLRSRVRIAYFLLGFTYLIAALSILLGCQPLSKNWQIYPDPGNLCQPTLSKLNVYGVVIPDILTDLYLLSIPLPLLWVVNIGLRRKLSLMALFSGAVFVIAAALARAITILQAGPEGAISGSQWACREVFVSIFVTNLPVIQPALRKAAKKVGLSGLFSKSTKSSASHPSGANTVGSAGIKLSRKKGTHPLSLPQTTRWGSDEQILVQSAPSALSKSPPSDSRDIFVSREFTVTTNNA